MPDNPIRDKSYRFAIRIVKMVQHIQAQHREYVLTKQILRSGTSIGANVEEALAGQSRLDFAAKMAIASKEARETHYWLRLLRDTDYLSTDATKSIENDCIELKKMLTSIVKTTQES